MYNEIECFYKLILTIPFRGRKYHTPTTHAHMIDRGVDR